MKLKTVLAIGLATLTTPALANVASCPEPESISVAHFTYTASNEAGDWIGIASQRNRGSIVSFREAVIFDLQPRKLQKCTYNLSDGVVDLYMDENRDTPVSIDNYESGWERMTGGWFDVFECRGSASSCQFELAQ